MPAEESKLRDLMWRHAGVFRDGATLTAALEEIAPAWDAVDEACARGDGIDAGACRLSSLLMVSRLIVCGAVARRESRGAHARADFPAETTHWKDRGGRDGQQPAPPSGF